MKLALEVPSHACWWKDQPAWSSVISVVLSPAQLKSSDVPPRARSHPACTCRLTTQTGPGLFTRRCGEDMCGGVRSGPAEASLRRRGRGNLHWAGVTDIPLRTQCLTCGVLACGSAIVKLINHEPTVPGDDRTGRRTAKTYLMPLTDDTAPQVFIGYKEASGTGHPGRGVAVRP